MSVKTITEVRCDNCNLKINPDNNRSRYKTQYYHIYFIISNPFSDSNCIPDLSYEKDLCDDCVTRRALENMLAEPALSAMKKSFDVTISIKRIYGD
jgi:hypothetical protein